MVGIPVSFWDGVFLGALAVSFREGDPWDIFRYDVDFHQEPMRFDHAALESWKNEHWKNTKMEVENAANWMFFSPFLLLEKMDKSWNHSWLFPRSIFWEAKNICVFFFHAVGVRSRVGVFWVVSRDEISMMKIINYWGPKDRKKTSVLRCLTNCNQEPV